jgi:transposase
MGIHKNAVLTPTGREILVRRVIDDGQRPMSVATDMGVSLSTVRKWVPRYRSAGVAGLHDRSSRPHRSPAQTSTGVPSLIELGRLLQVAERILRDEESDEDLQRLAHRWVGHGQRPRLSTSMAGWPSPSFPRRPTIIALSSGRRWLCDLPPVPAFAHRSMS